MLARPQLRDFAQRAAASIVASPVIIMPQLISAFAYAHMADATYPLGWPHIREPRIIMLASRHWPPPRRQRAARRNAVDARPGSR